MYNSYYNRFIKRYLGFILSLVFLVFLSPIYLLLSLIIVFETGWPVFYTPLRGGYRNKPFKIFNSSACNVHVFKYGTIKISVCQFATIKPNIFKNCIFETAATKITTIKFYKTKCAAIKTTKFHLCIFEIISIE